MKCMKNMLQGLQLHRYSPNVNISILKHPEIFSKKKKMFLMLQREPEFIHKGIKTNLFSFGTQY